MDHTSRGLVFVTLMSVCAGCVSAAPEADEDVEAITTSEGALVNFNGVMSMVWAAARRPAPRAGSGAAGGHIDIATGEPLDVGHDAVVWSPAELRAMPLNSLIRTFSSSEEAPANWNAVTARFGRFMDHLVQCALPKGRYAQVTILDETGAGNPTFSRRYQGLIGYAPAWESAGIANDVDLQQAVSACVAARMNRYGVPVSVSLRDPDLAIMMPTTPERARFPRLEGAFWGNIFLDTPQLYSCSHGANRDYSRSMGRECAAGACADIVDMGECSTACSAAYAGDGTSSPSFSARGARSAAGFDSCGGSTRVVTAFLGEESLRPGDFASASDVPEVGPFAFSCERGNALGSLSVDAASSRLSGASCVPGGSDLFSGRSVTRRSFAEGARAGRSSREIAGWSGANRIECAEDEYVSTVSTEHGELSSVECTAGSVRGDACRLVDMAAAEGGALSAGCELGEHIAGVRFDRGSAPAITGLLCCVN